VPYKDPEKRKRYSHKYYQEHKKEMSAAARQYRQEHKEEIRANHRQYYLDHKAKMNAVSCQYRKDHREERAACDRKYYEAHKEEALAYQRQYYKDNPEKMRAQSKRRDAKRRARKANTNVEGLSLDDINRILEAGCFFCESKEGLTIAHDIPVSKSGDTTKPNLFCLCQSCNSKMGVKNLSEMLSQTRLSFN